MADALAQFKQGKSIEVQESERDIALNKEYNEPLKVSLEDQKADLLKSLYGVQKQETVEDSKINKEKQEQNTELTSDDSKINKETELNTENRQETSDNTENRQETSDNTEKKPIKIEDNKYYPVINRLHEQNQISKETYEELSKSIQENNGELNIDSLLIDGEEKKLIEGFVEELDLKNEDKNIMNLGKDIKDIEEFKDFNTQQDKNGKFDSEVLNLIGKNYLKIQVGDKESNPKLDISTAIETTKNHILKEVKNIPKDSQTYLTAIENISSGNLKQQLEGINSLYIISYSSEGKLAKKEINSYTKKRKEELKARAREITIEMNKPENKNNAEKLYKLNLEKTEIIAEAKEIDGGDIFEAGDIDKVSEKISTGKEDKS